MTEVTHPQTVPLSLLSQRSDPFQPPGELLRLRDEAPLHPLTFPDGHQGWLVTGYAVAREVFADPRFSAWAGHTPDPVQPEPIDPGLFIRMDPPDHTRYRRLLTGQFTVRRINQLTSRVEEIVTGQLDEMERTGPPTDLVQAYALPIPSIVICELLGVPYADRATFQTASATLLNLDSTVEQASEAMHSLFGYLGELVARKHVEPTDDLLSGLVASGELTDEELINIGILLLNAGHETTANMLGLGTFALLQHPEQLAMLREDPGLIDGAVEELLRYTSILQFHARRIATEDVELAGRPIEAGQVLVLSLPVINRDADRFAEPDRLEVTRAPSGHLSFGHGVHQCLGQQLARIEMRIGYSALLSRFPGLRLAVAPEDVPLRSDMAIYGVHELPVTW